MTKSELIERVAQITSVRKGQIETVVNLTFEALTQALDREERIEVRGLGSFEIRHYGAYKGRNPRTGQSVAVKPKRLPFFKPGKELKDLINSSVKRTQDVPAFLPAEPSRPTPMPKAHSALRRTRGAR
jgi:integration host factor subunit beta